ncbi:response regulator transcription factor [Nocardioides daejeonensis]|uniref:response regulator transcription factor n=1 Tax=Nocardioides daejeonensis TaxID=1046556 RepID=UPI000D747FF5|nr:response regulator transcription factor [Nocardioides daejeonensis]
MIPGSAVGGTETRGIRRVAIVEDHLLQRRRTEEIVREQQGLLPVWSGESLLRLRDWLAHAPRANHPHLVVLDLQVDRGPNVDPDDVRALSAAGIRVLVVSALASPELVRQVLRAGVGGVVGKRDSESDLVGAIWTVLGGGHWLTPELASVIAGDPNRPVLSDQEERALALYASGLTMDAVAQALGVQPDTAKKYIGRVKAKYAAAGEPVRTKIDLNTVAKRDGYLA